MDERNTITALENEFHADFFAKKYGGQVNGIHNLEISLKRNFDGVELAKRI